jgi:SNF2 family DNA or RNA helicase
MQIVENKGLLLRLKNPEKVTAVIPKSKVLEDGSLLVKWGLEEAQVLKNLRIKNVPSPIEAHYEWPGLHKPFAHQKKTAAFLTLHRKAFCFNEQGTGKTSSVIWAADYLMNIGQIKRVLVICPLSIMQSAWQNDLFKFAMHRTSAVAHSYSRDKRVEAINSGAEFVIINFDGTEIVFDALDTADFDLVVIDECSALKNPNTNRWKTINKLIKAKTWLWMLTGTPAAQSPVDAYGLAKMVNPSGVPKYFGAFKDMVMQRITQFKWVPRPRAEQVVHQVLQPAIRFTKEECLDLPDITYTTREIPLTAQQKKYYKLLREQMVATAAGEEVTVVNAAAKLNKLLQLSCGAVYSDNGEIIAFDAKNRLDALKEVIEEASHKVLVFVAYTHAIYIIKEELTKAGIACDVINGQVSVTKRTEIFNKFQTEHDPQVLIIQPQAAAHGVTLTAANVVVWWGPITSTEIYLQANARTHRTGQRNPVTIVHLQGSDAEKKIYKMLSGNIDIHSRLVDLYKNLEDDS